MDLPSGAVGLLFTDIESSMLLWSVDAEAMASSLELHDELVAGAIESFDGYVFTRAGDSFAAAFSTADAAMGAARRCQQLLADALWPGPTIKARVGVHVGDVQVREGDYFGPAVNLAARVASAGHGGQVVATAAVVSSSGGAGSTALLGRFTLKGQPDPIEIHQVGPGEFPPLRAESVGSTSLRFDGFEVDLAARVLRADGDVVHTEPQVLDVLIFLLANRDRLVTREELLDEVWGDQFVSLSALTTRIKEARRALGDDGRTQRYIRNERGRGYQFVGEIDELSEPAASDSAGEAPRSPGPPGIAIYGRDEDLSAVGEMIDSSSVTTVMGPGGVGKTTLVSALLERWGATGREAVMVRLEGVRDEAGLTPALMTALGLAGGTAESAVEACAHWLAASGQVLVLDNCEHLLSAVRDFVAQIVELAPTVSVVATSRHRLGLAIESVYRLEPLFVPDSFSGEDEGTWPCIELFVAAGRRAGGMQALSDTDSEAVLELCRRLDGLPLAIELAASRLSTLGLRDLSGRLDDRLDWFRNRDVDSVDRQRSLRATVEWSFRFLEEECIDLVAALALFPAGLGYGDVAELVDRLELAVPADELLARLVDASVLTAATVQGRARYSMLETIRQFGLESLGERPDLRASSEDQLLAHALGIADEEREYWIGERDPRQRSLRRLRQELPNLRAARELMIARGNRSAAVQLAVGLCAFTEEACLTELWAWHDTTDIGPSADSGSDTAAVLLLDATALRNSGDIKACREVAAAAADQTDDRWIKGRALHTGAMGAMFDGDPFRAADLWIESDEQLGGCRGRLFAAMACAFAGDLDRAASHLAQCEIDDDSPVPVDLFTNVHLVRGEVARIADTGGAKTEFEQAAAVARRHGLTYSLGMAQVPLVALLEADGDTAAAAVGYEELIELFLRSGTWTHVWTTLRNAARLLSEHDPATALLIGAASEADASAPALDDASRQEAESHRSRAVEQLGIDEVARIERRASLSTKVDVVREAIAALRSVA